MSITKNVSNLESASTVSTELVQQETLNTNPTKYYIMSPTVKYLIGFLVLLCFVQYNEMTVIPLDDNATEPNSELAIMLRDILDGITDLLKSVVDGDTLNKVIQNFTKAIEVVDKKDR